MLLKTAQESFPRSNYHTKIITCPGDLKNAMIKYYLKTKMTAVEVNQTSENNRIQKVLKNEGAKKNSDLNNTISEKL